MGRVYLVGLTGSGKTTLGKALARDLGWDFCDMDDEVVAMSGKTIPELFEQGEAHFRDWESRAVTQLSTRQNCVIACGGGAVLREENRRCMRQTGLVILNDRPVENIVSDIRTDGRPLLQEGRDKLYELDRQRRDIYRAAAHKILQNTGTRKDAVRQLTAMVRAYREENQ